VTGRRAGGDPVGEDGLAEPVAFRTPRWFTVAIAVAVPVCFAAAGRALGWW